MRLKEKTKFVWRANKSLIKRFKEYSHGQTYDTPLFDNICIKFYPNGLQNKLHEKCLPLLKLLSFPINAEMMRVIVSVKSNFGKAEFSSTIDRKVRVCPMPPIMFNTEMLSKELIFEVEVIIAELQDSNNRMVPRSQWAQNNIDLLSTV